MFEFHVEDITSLYHFNTFIFTLKSYFIARRQEIFDKYCFFCHSAWDGNIRNYQYFRYEYRDLIQNVLKEVISKYRNYLPKKCLIVEFGSFVKGTERILSDFDFTICYDEPKQELYEGAEELIDFSLSKIFDVSIDHIHGKFQHYPLIPEFNKYTEKDNQYRLIFSDGAVDYKCGPETLIENLTHIKNVRDYKTMLDGYKEKYEKKINIDCLYSISIIENSTDHDFLLDLKNLEDQNNICDGYAFQLDKIILPDPFSISELKKALKDKCIVQFYIFLSKLRKIIRIYNYYSMSVDNIWNNDDFIKLFGREYVSSLKDAFITLIFYWNRMEYSLNRRNIALSTRCYIRMTHEEMNAVLASDWGIMTTIDIAVAARNRLISLVSEGVNVITKS